MSSIAQMASSIRNVLVARARQFGETSGFIERERVFDGATFTQMLIFSWLGNPSATLEEMSRVACLLGVKVSRQGISQRFNQAAAQLMYEVLNAAVEQAISGSQPDIDMLKEFNGVYLIDSSIIQLPDELIDVWRGSGGGRKGQENAGLKLSVRWNWQTGELSGPELHDACQHDQIAEIARGNDLPAGSLFIADLGYFKLERFEQLEKQQGYWLSRYKTRTHVFTSNGRQLELASFLHTQTADQIQLSVHLGANKRLACRLVAQRLPVEQAAKRREQLQKEAQREGKKLSRARWILAGWIVVLSNIPCSILTNDQLLLMYRVRWQIELLFKLWKSEGLIDEWRTTNPWRILCEIYAKLTAQLIQHWLLICGCWHRPERSLFQACQVVRHLAWALAFTLSRADLFTLFLSAIVNALASGVAISKQQNAPPTFQRLLAA